MTRVTLHYFQNYSITLSLKTPWHQSTVTRIISYVKSKTGNGIKVSTENAINAVTGIAVSDATCVVDRKRSNELLLLHIPIEFR